MKLYYRADTRSPEEIYPAGFKARMPLTSNKHPWWYFGLLTTGFMGIKNDVSSTELNHGRVDQTQISDVASKHVVCFSDKLEATPIFPINPDEDNSDDEIYIYAMALPDASCPDVFKFNNTQTDIEVFDMHAFQVREAARLIAESPEKNPVFIAQGLCGYEAYAAEVKPEQIICAIKCKRSALKSQTLGLEVFAEDKQFALPFERDFQLDNHILYNPQFMNQDSLKEKATEVFSASIKKGKQPTITALQGLEESQIKYNPAAIKKITLFRYALSHYLFGDALFYLGQSIKNFFVSTWGFLKDLFFTPRTSTEITTADFSFRTEQSPSARAENQGVKAPLQEKGKQLSFFPKNNGGKTKLPLDTHLSQSSSNIGL